MVNKAKAVALADKYIAKQNYNKALNELLKVEKVSPTDINLLNKIGDLYGKLNKRGDAIKYFTKVAESYQKGGFNLKAIALYKKIIRIDSRYMDARDRLVNLYLQQGHHSEAKGELRRMAEHYHSENLFARALSCYEKMVKLDPSNLDARIKITDLLMREGRRSDALTHYIAMASELIEKKMSSEAQKIVTKGLQLESGNAELLTIMAKIHLSQGKIDEALHQLTEVCRQNEGNTEALILLGQTYMDQQRLREANACFLRALHMSEAHIPLVEQVATAFIQSDQLDDAYQSLIHINEIFLSRREFDECIRLFRSILYKDENHLPSLDMMVTIYEKAGQISNAILTLEKIIQFHKVRGNRDEEIATMQRLLSLEPNHPEWRPLLDKMVGNLSDPYTGEMDKTETHIFVDEDMSIEDVELAADISPEEKSNDDLSRITNLLTDAEMSLKYGLIEPAIEHLQAVKELDLLNITANIKLKEIFRERKQVDNAVGCMVCLINAYIDEQRFDDAANVIKEIEALRPDIASIHRSRLGNLMSEDPMAHEDSMPFGYAEPDEPENIDFNSGDDPEVVDFSQMKKEPASQDDGEAYSLDIPKPMGGASDLADMYNLDNSAAHFAGDGFSLDFAPEEAPATEEPVDIGSDFDDQDLDFVDEEDDAAPEMTLVGDLPAEEENIEDLDDLEEVTDLDDAFEEIEEVTDLEELEEAELEEPDSGLIFVDDGTSQEEIEEEEPADLSFLDEEEIETPVETEPEPRGNLTSLASELEEIDFFISVEAFEDARNLITDALSRFGEHPLIMERQHEVDAKTQAEHQQKLSFSKDANSKSDDKTDDLFDTDGGGFFDLAAELNEELFDGEEDAIVNDNTNQEEIQSVDELFQEFKKGVDEQIDEEDHQTHYDLGIAYKEMGLLDEAISEFEKAKIGPGRYLECTSMIGTCLVELGRQEDVVTLFSEAVSSGGVDQDGHLALQYELGRAYESMGDFEQALNVYKEIQNSNTNYRDLVARVEALQA